jgi:hypothetical protein
MFSCFFFFAGAEFNVRFDHESGQNFLIGRPAKLVALMQPLSGYHEPIMFSYDTAHTAILINRHSMQ